MSTSDFGYSPVEGFWGWCLTFGHFAAFLCNFYALFILLNPKILKTTFRSHSAILLFQLVVGDTLFGMIDFPMSLIALTSNDSRYVSDHCHILGPILFFSVGISLTSLNAMAIERWFQVVLQRPMTNKEFVVQYIFLLCFLLTIVIWPFLIPNSDPYQMTPTKTFCEAPWHQSAFQTVAIFSIIGILLALVESFAAYYWIKVFLKKTMKEIYQNFGISAVAQKTVSISREEDDLIAAGILKPKDTREAIQPMVNEKEKKMKKKTLSQELAELASDESANKKEASIKEELTNNQAIEIKLELDVQPVTLELNSDREILEVEEARISDAKNHEIANTFVPQLTDEKMITRKCFVILLNYFYGFIFLIIGLILRIVTKHELPYAYIVFESLNVCMVSIINPFLTLWINQEWRSVAISHFKLIRSFFRFSAYYK